MRLQPTIFAAALALATTGCGIALNTAASLDRFRDPEVAMVLHVMSLAEVREGNLARDKASSKPVQEFAAQMSSEHAQASSHTENELGKKDIPSADSDLSREIDTESGKTVESLRARTGADFDRAYLDRAIAFHRYAIDTIDKTLKPAAKNKVVLTALDETRALAEKHLAKAQELRKGM
jgi:putative membrane protein